MKISTKGRYALRVMVDLAAHADESEYIRLKDISQRQGITICPQLSGKQRWIQTGKGSERVHRGGCASDNGREYRSYRLSG